MRGWRKPSSIDFEQRDVAELSPSTRDEDVLAMANDKKAVLITNDKDFGELVFRRRLINSGVVLLRLGGLSDSGKADLVSIAVTDHGHELDGAFTVVEPGLIRIRPRGDFQ
jgi:predicted nuclease of predicted toxin-antitoxin system